MPSTLAFTARTVSGAEFNGATLAGRPTVLWFWAPWCPTCLQQAPGVREALHKFADKVNIVGVAGSGPHGGDARFLRWAKIETMTTIADEPGVVWKRFNVTAQSMFVLIDASGQVTLKGQLSLTRCPTGSPRC